jgi:hypothetical protein
MTPTPQMELAIGVLHRMLASIAALAATKVAGAHG